MIFFRNKKNQGIALIIVMIVIAVLAVIATGFAFSMRVETKLARNTRFNPDNDWLGRSGVELARYILSKPVPNENFDALHQKWAGGQGRAMMMEAIALEPWEELPMKNVRLGQGSLSIKITDTERKFNINAAPEPLLRFVLELWGVDATDVGDIIAAINDWKDADDIKSDLGGAESDDYLDEDPPYYAKNGPLDHISELRMIQGIKEIPELYENFEKHFTAISNGRVNINTAGREVLMLMPGMDEIIAGEIINDRSINNMEGMGPYRQPSDVNRVLGAFGLQGALDNYITTRSETFEVEVTTKMGKQERRYVALLRKLGPQEIRILYFHSK